MHPVLLSLFVCKVSLISLYIELYFLQRECHIYTRVYMPTRLTSSPLTSLTDALSAEKIKLKYFFHVLLCCTEHYFGPSLSSAFRYCIELHILTTSLETVTSAIGVALRLWYTPPYLGLPTFSFHILLTSRSHCVFFKIVA